MVDHPLFLVAATELTQGGTVFDAVLWSFVAMVSAAVSAWIGAVVQPPKRITAMILAFSCGLLISLLCFDLMKVALDTGGIVAALTGFFIGLFVYVYLNRLVCLRGVGRRCSSSCGGIGGLTPDQQQEKAAAIALLFGATIDGIPESMSIGISLLDNPLVSFSVVSAVAVANIPEGLASGAGLARSGYSLRQIMLTWSGVVLLCVLSAGLAHSLMETAPNSIKAIFTALAGGGVLAMTLQTVIPEAYAETQDSVSILGGIGFALSFCVVALFH
tara:strand:+ start:80 stop:898 length:819 start_codon:yes stop_codon:yes gene_type:complete